ncbi:MAG: EF-hand domain-containing protein [Hyphomicrobium sp.]|uniref:hypothetical protein n=1 Tax=Hyphomicrobium sp. TaxID=82 RepID=UPI0039E50257
MQNKWLACACFLLLSGSAAVADGWTDKFKTLDSDGNGTVSRTEYDANVSKLKLDPAPQFSAVDTDNNNSIDSDEWSAAEKLTTGYNTPCTHSTESWCPKK